MYIRIPKDVNEYEQKVFQGLSTRNIVWLLIAAVTAVLTYFLFKNIIPMSVLSWIIMILTVPMFAVGFLRYQNITFEKWLIIIYDFYSKNRRCGVNSEWEEEKNEKGKGRKKEKRPKKEGQ